MPDEVSRVPVIEPGHKPPMAPPERPCAVCGRYCQGSAAPADNGSAVCGNAGPWQPFGGDL